MILTITETRYLMKIEIENLNEYQPTVLRCDMDDEEHGSLFLIKLCDDL